MAVLPFENLTGDPSQDYLSEGFTEELISQLGNLEPQRLRVLARASAARYQGNGARLSAIGRDLDVSYVIEGSVRREGERLRITAELIQVKDQTNLWSRSYDREFKSLLTVENEIGQEIADEIQLSIGKPAEARAAREALRKPPSTSTSYEAYDLYLKGRYFWNQRTASGFQHAAENFQEAIRKDPNYARPYAGLADTYALMSSWGMGPPNELIPKARAAAVKALELDESLAEAHTSVALIAQNYDYDWKTAEKEYKRAIQLDPAYPTAHEWYAECLSYEGRFDEALAESELARQMDPLSLIIATDHAAILYFARQYDRAIAQFHAVEELKPPFLRVHMVEHAYVQVGRYADALADLEDWRRADPTPETWATEAYVYAHWGRRAQADRAMRKFEQENRHSDRDPLLGRLLVQVAMGHKSEAIETLQEAYRRHSNVIGSLKVDPDYDSLRGDPRFQDLLRKVGLAE